MVSAIYYDTKKGERPDAAHLSETTRPISDDDVLLQHQSPTLCRSRSSQTLMQLRAFDPRLANRQDFIPHLRYTTSSPRRVRAAVAVRARRDQWLASMLASVRNRLGLSKAMSRKCVAEMLLTNKARLDTL
ncbi:hypothetical protein PV04_04064 [Phialophora macrospora]|uniref:Uncharacterized protein n=1 Tax=Phialophora macrospora TaxID=1851006 RepID=A0A0D2CSF8_9EURO|nr:hypothetical protein PV04_04064 [Phialophora macrospora]